MIRNATLLLAALAAIPSVSFAQYTVGGGGAALIPDTPALSTGNDTDMGTTTLPLAWSLIPLTTPVPASATNIKSVKLTGFTHTWAGDVQAVLWEPTMTTGYNLIKRAGATTPASLGFLNNYNGDYTFLPAGDAGITQAWPLVSPGGDLPAGNYPQEYGGLWGAAWVSGSVGVFNTDLASIPVVPGTWILAIYDGAGGDTGALVSWSMSGDAGPLAVPYCFGDGTGTACPCTPVPLVGDPDKGCPNGPFPGGGKLTASGTASIGADTLVMTCTTINNGGAVIFQGTNDNGGGAGVAFGDGLRCAAGTVKRMKSHTVTTNTHQYPDPAFLDNSISIRGAVIAPGDRWYQGWYRSGLAHCNPTQNYNLTNGVKITWVL